MPRTTEERVALIVDHLNQIDAILKEDPEALDIQVIAAVTVVDLKNKLEMGEPKKHLLWGAPYHIVFEIINILVSIPKFEDAYDKFVSTLKIGLMMKKIAFTKNELDPKNEPINNPN